MVNLRRFLGLVVFVVITGSAYSQELAPHHDVSFGGGVTIESYKSGGFFEFGFPIIKEKVALRNHLQLAGYSGTTGNGGGVVTIGDKLSIGSPLANHFHFYGFIGGDFGLFATAQKTFTEVPYFWQCYGGGGIDLFADADHSFFAECGGGFNTVTSNLVTYQGSFLVTGYARISLGFRSFL